MLTVEELELVELICAPDAVEVDFDVLELVLTVEDDDDDKEGEEEVIDDDAQSGTTLFSTSQSQR